MKGMKQSGALLTTFKRVLILLMSLLTLKSNKYLVVF